MIEAAGTLPWRDGRVALVYRDRFDDWTLPKGKPEPGEHPVTTAVRETHEETGLRVRLAQPLPTTGYETARGSKRVRYWAAEVLSEDGFAPNAEITAVEWLPASDAQSRLSYPHDREVVAKFLATGPTTGPVIVIRHASAEARGPGSDRTRPLSAVGRREAAALGELLAAYGPTQLLSSPARRCLDTLGPYADRSGLPIRTVDALAEDSRGGADRASGFTEFTELPELPKFADLAARARTVPTVICSHRPVLPQVFRALGIDAGEPLHPAETLVAHFGLNGAIAVERHRP